MTDDPKPTPSAEDVARELHVEGYVMPEPWMEWAVPIIARYGEALVRAALTARTPGDDNHHIHQVVALDGKPADVPCLLCLAREDALAASRERERAQTDELSAWHATFPLSPLNPKDLPLYAKRRLEDAEARCKAAEQREREARGALAEVIDRSHGCEWSEVEGGNDERGQGFNAGVKEIRELAESIRDRLLAEPPAAIERLIAAPEPVAPRLEPCIHSLDSRNCSQCDERAPEPVAHACDHAWGPSLHNPANEYCHRCGEHQHAKREPEPGGGGGE